MHASVQYTDSTSGIIGPSGREIVVYAVVFSGAAGTEQVLLHNGTTSSDPTLFNLGINATITDASIYAGTYSFPNGVIFPAGCYMELSSAINVSVAYTVLQ